MNVELGYLQTVMLTKIYFKKLPFNFGKTILHFVAIQNLVPGCIELH